MNNHKKIISSRSDQVHSDGAAKAVTNMLHLFDAPPVRRRRH